MLLSRPAAGGRGVARQSRLEGLPGQDAGDQSGGGAAVTGVENAVGLMQAVESFAVDQDMVGRIFDGDAQPAKTVYRGEAVRAL